MSLQLANIVKKTGKKLSRSAALALSPKKVYDDGRTQNTFKDETDINKIMERAQRTGTISHLAKHQLRYGDFANYDFLENQIKIVEGRQLFDELPSEIRKEFEQPAKFFSFVNDPANKDRLEELLPALAAPGKQLLDVSGKTPPPKPAAPAAPSEPVANVTPPADPPAATPDPAPVSD